LLLSSTCKGGKQRLLSEKGQKVRFEIKSLQKTLGDCDNRAGLCAQIDLIYPLVAEGEPTVRNKVNERIVAELIQNFVFEGYKGLISENQLSVMADSFLVEWQRTVDKDETTTGWEVNVTGEVGLHTPKAAAITLGTYAYSGGAHPNSFLTLLNFDLKSGRVLAWEDFITDMKALKNIALEHFKKARSLPPDADLTLEGYFWGEPFALPANFELQEEGIYCWYNPYEVASYAQGPTDFLITYEQLGKVVNKARIF
jgi:hypothetical protein